MELREAMRGKRVYFDANIFIYLLEGFSSVEHQLTDIRASIKSGESEIFTSDLTLCEVLVAPFRSQKHQEIVQYRKFIEESGAFSLLGTGRDTYIRASLYRAEFGLKTPDAIHVAAAIEAGCTLFVTNDKAITTPSGLVVYQL